jgi:hypothetical protein
MEDKMSPVVWITALIMHAYPIFTQQQAIHLAENAVVVCEATVGEVETRPFMKCILDTIPGVVDSATRNE